MRGTAVWAQAANPFFQAAHRWAWKGFERGADIIRAFIWELDHGQKIQRPYRARDSGARHSTGRRRRSHLRRLRRRVAGKLSRNCEAVRGYAGGRVAPPANADRHVPAAVRRTHSVDSPAGRQGVHRAKAHLAVAASWDRYRPQTGG